MAVGTLKSIRSTQALKRMNAIAHLTFDPVDIENMDDFIPKT
jgi:hypothetical protein